MNDLKKNNASLEKRLAGWHVEVPADPLLKQSVLGRIAAAEADQTSDRFTLSDLTLWIAGNRLAAAALACTAILMTSTSVLLVREHHMREQIAMQSHAYFMLIDPVARIEAAGTDVTAEPSVVDMLAWMQDRFDLSREQFQALVGLHGEYSDRLVALYKELSGIQAQYQAFDKQRRNNEPIDFMALYDLLRERDAVRKDSTETSRQLVELVLRVLTPDQKREYISLLNKIGTLPQNLPKTPKTHAGA